MIVLYLLPRISISRSPIPLIRFSTDLIKGTTLWEKCFLFQMFCIELSKTPSQMLMTLTQHCFWEYIISPNFRCICFILQTYILAIHIPLKVNHDHFWDCWIISLIKWIMLYIIAIHLTFIPIGRFWFAFLYSYFLILWQIPFIILPKWDINSILSI